MSERKVAGIVDRNGGIRVVVSSECLYCHLNAGERIFITPFTVDGGTIASERDPRIGVVEQAGNYVKAELLPNNLCGGCTFCCRAPAIDVLNKPAGAMCQHQCGGCQIQKTKPATCNLFECLWLKSQRVGLPMRAELRPDRCGVMFTADTTNTPRDPDLIEVHAENEPQRLDNEYVKAFLRGKKTYFVTHYLSKLSPAPKPKLPTKSLVGIVYYADDPEQKIFRWVYPTYDDAELDGPPTYSDGSIMKDDSGEPYSWTTLPGPCTGRAAVLEKIPADDPRAAMRW